MTDTIVNAMIVIAVVAAALEILLRNKTINTGRASRRLRSPAGPKTNPKGEDR